MPLMPERTPVVTIVHTSFLAVEPLIDLFDELGPEIQLRHIVDDSLLPEVIEAGEMTERVRARLIDYFHAAAMDGADVVFSQCSSVGDAAELAATQLDVPVMRIDEPMARAACEAGSRIGIVATLATTLAPTRRLVERIARVRGRSLALETRVVEGAFAALEAGDHSAHDDAVAAAIRELLPRVDAVLCAQGTMARAVESLGEPPVPVLTSPRLGVAAAVARARAIAARRR